MLVLRTSVLAAAPVLAVLFGHPRPVAAQGVARVQVAPPTISIRVGEKYGLVGVAYDRNGSVLLQATINWATNNRTVATVDQDGTVTGVAPGVAVITARVGQQSATAQVLVQQGAGGGG